MMQARLAEGTRFKKMRFKLHVRVNLKGWEGEEEDVNSCWMT